MNPLQHKIKGRRYDRVHFVCPTRPVKLGRANSYQQVLEAGTN